MSSANGAHAANPAGSGLTADVLIIGGGVIGLAIAGEPPSGVFGSRWPIRIPAAARRTRRPGC